MGLGNLRSSDTWKTSEATRGYRSGAEPLLFISVDPSNIEALLKAREGYERRRNS